MALSKDDVADGPLRNLPKQLASASCISQGTGIDQDITLEGSKQIAVADAASLIDPGSALHSARLIPTGLDEISDPEADRGWV